MTLYNVIFTALSPIVIGIFDRDVDKEVALKYPGLYKQSGCLTARLHGCSGLGPRGHTGRCYASLPCTALEACGCLHLPMAWCGSQAACAKVTAVQC